MIKNVMVTGGSGNLGQYVLEELGDDYNVTIYDRVTPKEHPKFPWETDKPIVIGAMDSIGECMRAINLAKADAIIQLPAMPWPTDSFPFHVPERHFPEDETMRSNVLSTYYLMEAAQRLGVKKVVFASSFYTLGFGNMISGRPFAVDYLPLDENHPCRPEDTYSLSKVLCEEMLTTYSRAYGIQCVALRFFGIDGQTVRNLRKPREGRMTKERPDFKGGPKPGTGQYVDVRDCAQSCRLGLETKGLDPFEAFFIATDDLYLEDIRDVVRKMFPDYAHLADNIDPNDGIISMKKAVRKLGYRPKHSWRSEGSRYNKLAESD